MSDRILILLAGLWFSFWENAYFGWNWFPQSDAELLADGIGILIVSLAFVRKP